METFGQSEWTFLKKVQYHVIPTCKINAKVHPVFTSHKIKDELKAKEPKPPIANQQNVVYISLSVICVMQIMLALQVDTFINVWGNTNDW